MENMKLILLIFIASMCEINTYKILGVFPLGMKSHWTIGHSIMKTLANAGHDVYVISPFAPKPSINRYTHIQLDYDSKVGLGNSMDIQNFSPMKKIRILSKVVGQVANLTLSHPNVQKLMQDEQHFDLVIVEIFYMEALYGLAAHFDCPIICSSTFGTSKWTNDLTKAPMEYAYVPHNMIKYSENMNFMQRTYNMLVSQYENFFMKYFHYKRQEEIYDFHFGHTKRSFSDQMKNVSLVFIYQHFSISSIRPFTANMIEIGGLHVNDVQPLPSNIKEFLDSATDGVILFSLGSIVHGVHLPDEKREIFTRAFGKLKQKVIWKYENETLKHKPDNVMITSWLPQRDILAHRNVKLFITHGGLLGMTEAIIESVPCIGMPFFSDQKMNMLKAVSLGFGKIINYKDISEELIVKSVNEILTNKEYEANAKAVSKLFKDRPMSPQQSAVYWVEYVIRNHGASHFKSAAHNLNYFQLHLIDSYVFVGIVVGLIIYIVTKVMKMFVKRILKSFANEKVKNY